jgi:hypothetical protein
LNKLFRCKFKPPCNNSLFNNKRYFHKKIAMDKMSLVLLKQSWFRRGHYSRPEALASQGLS